MAPVDRSTPTNKRVGIRRPPTVLCFPCKHIRDWIGGRRRAPSAPKERYGPVPPAYAPSALLATLARKDSDYSAYVTIYLHTYYIGLSFWYIKKSYKSLNI